jgi:hypothetical protein
MVEWYGCFDLLYRYNGLYVAKVRMGVRDGVPIVDIDRLMSGGGIVSVSGFSMGGVHGGW